MAGWNGVAGACAAWLVGAESLVFWQALADGKEKKAAKLEEAKQDAAGKAATLAGKAPITHSLRHEKELRTLWKKVTGGYRRDLRSTGTGRDSFGG